MSLNKTKPPKNREFLALVESKCGSVYWDFFIWATNEHGATKSGFMDRQLYDMPPILGWVELPNLEGESLDVPEEVSAPNLIVE